MKSSQRICSSPLQYNVKESKRLLVIYWGYMWYPYLVGLHFGYRFWTFFYDALRCRSGHHLYISVVTDHCTWTARSLGHTYTSTKNMTALILTSSLEIDMFIYTYIKIYTAGVCWFVSCFIDESTSNCWWWSGCWSNSRVVVDGDWNAVRNVFPTMWILVSSFKEKYLNGLLFSSDGLRFCSFYKNRNVA